MGAAVVAWRNVGREGLARFVELEPTGAWFCRSPPREVDGVVKPGGVDVFDVAAKRWAARWTFEGKVPALGLLNPGP